MSGRAYQAWDRSQRRAAPFAGLRLFERTSDRYRFSLASRHYPHLLCWQWLLEWQFTKPGERRFFCRYHSMFGGWTLGLLWLGRIYYKRQNYDDMPALGPKGRGGRIARGDSIREPQA